MNKNIRIVEAIVNGLMLWRVYVNMHLEATFPSYEQALKYAADREGRYIEL